MQEKNFDSQKSDVEKLKDLSEVLTQYSLTAAEIFENDKKYRVEKIPVGGSKTVSGGNGSSLNIEKEQVDTIFSPMVGIFHDAYTENGSALIKVGQHFKNGDVLCVIEAMKTFTEVRADDSGIIKEICAKNGDLMEYSQPLFKYIKQ
ncbi:acetyl-CoA carboxylase biotin carboxyl carrier protein [Clostridium sp. CAG:557]|nr:acetyl-CoA carboxylase biotin carboxyl carrier protein [Clostridium sp. CAG:557]